MFQLRFKEGNGICRTEKTERYRLSEHPTTVSLLHQLLPKGIVSSFLLALIFPEQLRRLFTKSRLKINIRRRVSHSHFNACSTIYRPLINLLVRTAPCLGELHHRTDPDRPPFQTRLSWQSLSAGNLWTCFYSAMSKDSTGYYKTS